MPRVLVDTSVWIRHFRRAHPHLQVLVAGDRVLCDPLVLLEIACGAVDVSLLAPALLADGARLWTEDRTLRARAGRLGVGDRVPAH